MRPALDFQGEKAVQYRARIAAWKEQAFRQGTDVLTDEDAILEALNQPRRRGTGNRGRRA